ncbi:MAG: tRNA pseudouridine(55) synthase TruB [Gammaproteobacteria bacterium]|nr:tRNA pseudouridine(55) synthase TruB [Gammaproteobacteria bacterium]
MTRGRQTRARNKGRAINGIVILDKPRGESSNAALQQVKRLFNANKAGHTGSLDPLATGVLPICLGEATKISQFLLNSDKKYRVSIKLGIRTRTGDAEGEVIQQSDAVAVTTAEVKEALQRFTGPIKQVPPMYSAIKQNGVPLYKLAREGIEVERESRDIVIYSIDVLGLENNELEIDVHCSKGTYIRTLADDLGEVLGCGAHVSQLKRTQAGVFTESESVTIQHLREIRDSSETEDFSGLDEYLIDMDAAISDLPEVILPEVSAGWVKQGQAVLVRHLPEQGLVRLYQGEVFIGIGHILDDGRVAPRRMIVSH